MHTHRSFAYGACLAVSLSIFVAAGLKPAHSAESKENGSGSPIPTTSTTPAPELDKAKKTAATIQVSPKTQALVKRGIACSKENDFHHAIAAFNQAIRLDPLCFEAWFNRGWAYRQMGDFEHAISDYTSALKLQPRKAQVYLNRGWCHNRLNHDNEAMKDFDKAIEIDQAYINAYRNRGSLKLKVGDYQGAVDDFNQILTLDPNSKTEIGKYLQANAISDPNARAILESAGAKKALAKVSETLSGTNIHFSETEL